MSLAKSIHSLWFSSTFTILVCVSLHVTLTSVLNGLQPLSMGFPVRSCITYSGYCGVIKEPCWSFVRVHCTESTWKKIEAAGTFVKIFALFFASASFLTSHGSFTIWFFFASTNVQHPVQTKVDNTKMRNVLKIFRTHLFYSSWLWQLFQNQDWGPVETFHLFNHFCFLFVFFWIWIWISEGTFHLLISCSPFFVLNPGRELSTSWFPVVLFFYLEFRRELSTSWFPVVLFFFFESGVL